MHCTTGEAVAIVLRRSGRKRGRDTLGLLAGATILGEVATRRDGEDSIVAELAHAPDRSLSSLEARSAGRMQRIRKLAVGSSFLAVATIVAVGIREPKPPRSRSTTVANVASDAGGPRRVAKRPGPVKRMPKLAPEGCNSVTFRSEPARPASAAMELPWQILPFKPTAEVPFAQIEPPAAPSGDPNVGSLSTTDSRGSQPFYCDNVAAPCPPLVLGDTVTFYSVGIILSVVSNTPNVEVTSVTDTYVAFTATAPGYFQIVIDITVFGFGATTTGCAGVVLQATSVNPPASVLSVGQSFSVLRLLQGTPPGLTGDTGFADTWTLTRVGSLAPLVVAYPSGNGDYSVTINSPGTYTLSVTGELTAGQTLTSPTFRVEGRVRLESAVCGIGPGQTATLNAWEDDAYGLYAWTDLPMTFSFATTDPAYATFSSSGDTATVTAQSAIPEGLYGANIAVAD